MDRESEMQNIKDSEREIGNIADTEFGALIRNARMKANISQTELSRKVGVSRVSIYRWENNLCRPSYEDTLKISEVLGIKLVDFSTNQQLDADHTYREQMNKLSRDLYEIRQNIDNNMAIDRLRFIIITIMVAIAFIITVLVIGQKINKFPWRTYYDYQPVIVDYGDNPPLWAQE